jgi:hypothetical protein
MVKVFSCFSEPPAVAAARSRASEGAGIFDREDEELFGDVLQASEPIGSGTD